MTALYSLNEGALGYDRDPAVHHLTGGFVGGSLTGVVGAVVSGTLHSDSLSDRIGPAATYIVMFNHNTSKIVKALAH